MSSVTDYIDELLRTVADPAQVGEIADELRIHKATIDQASIGTATIGGATISTANITNETVGTLTAQTVNAQTVNAPHANIGQANITNLASSIAYVGNATVNYETVSNSAITNLTLPQTLTLDNSLTQLLARNSSTGAVEYRDAGSLLAQTRLQGSSTASQFTGQLTATFLQTGSQVLGVFTALNMTWPGPGTAYLGANGVGGFPTAVAPAVAQRLLFVGSINNALTVLAMDLSRDTSSGQLNWTVSNPADSETQWPAGTTFSVSAAAVTWLLG